MLANGIASPSQSQWSSPIVLAKKKDGTLRFCVDYRKLNKVTDRDSYPLPRMRDLFDKLSGAKYFTLLDLASGYWQIPMFEPDKHKTAFISQYGLFEFNVMPFGLVNAPMTFQRVMDVILTGVDWDFVLVYIDDICIISKTFSEHLIHLGKVFDRLRQHSLHLKMKKCFFCQISFPYLGHVVTKEGLATDPEKIRVIREMTPPKTTKEIASWIGLIGYYRRFVKNFAKHAYPITKLQKKGVKFVWELEQQKAFDYLTLQLINAPILAIVDFTRSFILQVDASKFGIGAVLAQKDDQGREHVVMYGSNALTDSQRKWHAIELECLAIVVFVQKFKVYLHGSKFMVFSDHQPLKWLMTFKDPSDRLIRCIGILQGVDFEVKYKVGKTNSNADAL